MKQLLLWIVLIVALITATSLALVHFKPVSTVWQQLVSPGPLTPRHAYLHERCTACHEPTVGVTVTNCTACHANSARLLSRQPTAFHASIEECVACHIEHVSTNIRPLVMDHVALAQIGVRTLARASRSEADSAATLRSLATWLLIQSPQHLNARTAREALNCVGCHDRQDQHLRRFGSDCAQCHAFGAWTVADYLHPSAQSKECVQCHQPPPSHFMEHFSMISQKFAGKEHAKIDQCFECHNTTSWNDILNVGYYKHH